jgi:polysaccharide pyruvyl transferase WcaK-like protein
MKQITLFNTAVCSHNTGDYIITDAVKENLGYMFSKDMMFETLTHSKISKETYALVKGSDYSFVGGTNLLSSNMQRYNQWKINLLDSIYLKDTILMGVGWWQYQDKPSLYTKFLLNRVLSKNMLHSVRDSYTEKKMHELGITNVLNTGCPTMWSLTKEHCANITRKKSKNVVFTLTDYNRDFELDQELVNILEKNYDDIYFWPQGGKDYEYISSLNISKNTHILGGNLAQFNNLLENLDIDYIGTRLHAGIRAIQKSVRSIIIGVDNRAEEKSKDFNLKVLSRDKIKQLDDIIKSEFATEISINEKNIQQWKNQFQ